MAVSILSLLLCLTISFHYGLGSGELNVLHSPDSIEFQGHEQLKESLVKEVFSAVLGMSVEQPSEWSGLVINDPFSSSEAVVAVFIEGVTSLGNKVHLKGHRYPLITDDSSQDVIESVQRRIIERFPESLNKLINIDLSEGPDGVNNKYKSTFGEIKGKLSKFSLQALKPKKNEEDFNFLQELELLNELTLKVEEGAVVPDNVPDLFAFNVKSLHALTDLHGENSAAVREAGILLAEALNKLNGAFKKAYDGDVVVTMITSDSSHTRRTRRSTANVVGIEQLNLADTYTADYPVIFNIIFWFVVVLIFSLMAITYIIGDMDPGRDSIIYRNTSNRMKKDN